MRIDKSWKYKTHRWFAWYPVYNSNTQEWIWLETVNRHWYNHGWKIE